MSSKKILKGDTNYRKEVLTACTSVLASLLLEDAQMEEVGSQLGGGLLATSAQG